ncbi:TetR/AcrR family transcriptional regulator [Aestuariicella sp. G3-2]|uniref:TetR/AcrR family transcriptional regulator n=1 Tax=Pseudomaricurvus albidus TaxID=2842452 RepID=UPI001C0B5088|nr:TetR/AcrR family transcriptional regulator [Aestuariicella albida]MBU3070926.1 TetR/AcrR family transcriptional regulator [Aestuariicella albida]
MTTPKQGRAKKTYESLLLAAQEILAESGLEKLNSNNIVARAGYSPPAFYRYFEDKFAVLHVLATRLMETQNRILEEIEQPLTLEEDVFLNEVTEIMRRTLGVTREFIAGKQLMILMRMHPDLQKIRINSHKAMTAVLMDAFQKQDMDLPEPLLNIRGRMIVEMGYACIEMLLESDFGEHENEVLRGSAVASLAILKQPA